MGSHEHDKNPKKTTCDHDHDHSHDHHHGGGHSDHSHHHQIVLSQLNSAAAIRRIKTAFYLNMAFALIELIGGFIIGSFAIIADAIHDFGDSLSLALALFLQKKSSQGASKDLSYGYQRFSILSSLLTGTIIIAGSAVIVVQGIGHLLQPQSVPHAEAMIGLAILGILVNGFAAFGLSHGHSHNEKILSWHLIEDVLGWVAVLVGAICIKLYQVSWIDPVLGIAIAVFIAYNVIRNLKAPLRIVLQYVPDAVDMNRLQTDLLKIEGLLAVADLHAWTLDGEQHVISAQLTVAKRDELRSIKRQARDVLAAMGFRYICLETEVEPIGEA